MFPPRADVAALPAFARRAEALGYGSLWVVEDCFLAGGMTAAATALAVTDRLEVGLGLAPALMRNPALLAMEAGTLARLHPGRFTLTLGHGVRGWMEQIGIAPTRRLGALRDVLDAVRRLLAGERVSAAGPHVHLDAVALEPAPAVPPRLLVGSTGERGMALGAGAADGVLLPEGCGQAFLRAAGAAAAGAHRVLYSWARLEPDAARLAGLARPPIERWARRGHYPGPAAAVGVGDPADVAPRLGALMPELVVGGTAEACAAGVATRLDAGATVVVLNFLGADPADQLEAFGRAVLPRL